MHRRPEAGEAKVQRRGQRHLHAQGVEPARARHHAVRPPVVPLARCPASHAPVRRRGGGDWTELFKEVSSKESTSAARAFHFNATFNTVEATCEQKADAGTAGLVAPCDGGPECTVQYFVGELFVAISPGWIEATSFNLLKADSHRIEVTLVQGWDECMPTTPAPGVHPVDALLAWMMEKSGRKDGFLARESWHGASQNSSQLWDVLNLKDCGDGASRSSSAECAVDIGYSPSSELRVFGVLYFSCVAVLLATLYRGYRTWERTQTGAWKRFTALFLPASKNAQREHAAQLAAWCRNEMYESLEGSGLRHTTSKDTNPYAWAAEYLKTEGKHINIEYSPSSANRFAADYTHFKAGGAKGVDGVNKPLTQEQFVEAFEDILEARTERRMGSGFQSIGGTGCARLCSALTCTDHEDNVCADLFMELADGNPEGECDCCNSLCALLFGWMPGCGTRRTLSYDALAHFVLFYTGDKRDDDDDHEEHSDEVSPAASSSLAHLSIVVSVRVLGAD